MSHDDHPITAGTRPTDDADYSRTEPAHLHMSVRDYIVIFAILMVLLVVTVLAAFLPHLGYVNILIAMTIALVKAVLVVLYFMHVRFSSRVTMIFVVSSALWLGILFVLTFSDYLTRPWEPMSRGWIENPVMAADREAVSASHGASHGDDDATAAHE